MTTALNSTPDTEQADTEQVDYDWEVAFPTKVLAAVRVMNTKMVAKVKNETYDRVLLTFTTDRMWFTSTNTYAMVSVSCQYESDIDLHGESILLDPRALTNATTGARHKSGGITHLLRTHADFVVIGGSTVGCSDGSAAEETYRRLTHTKMTNDSVDDRGRIFSFNAKVMEAVMATVPGSLGSACSPVVLTPQGSDAERRPVLLAADVEDSNDFDDLSWAALLMPTWNSWVESAYRGVYPFRGVTWGSAAGHFPF